MDGLRRITAPTYVVNTGYTLKYDENQTMFRFGEMADGTKCWHRSDEDDYWFSLHRDANRHYFFILEGFE